VLRSFLIICLALTVIVSAVIIWVVFHRQRQPSPAANVQPTVVNFTFSANDEDDALLPEPFIRWSETDTLSWATKKVEPVRPDTIQGGPPSGEVIVKVIIDEKGHVIRAWAASGPAPFHDAAIVAARKWTFQPWNQHGVRLKVVGRMRFSFYPPPQV
jgi:TonB family protein